MKVYIDAFRSALTSLYPWFSRSFWTGSHPANQFLKVGDQIPHPLFRSLDSGRQRRDMERRRAIMRLSDPITPDEWPILSICIVLFNSEPLLAGLFRALKDLEYPADRLELIIADNSAAETTSKALDSHLTSIEDWNRIELIIRKNDGYGSGQNAAVKAARGKFIMLLNPDARPQPHSLNRAVSRALADRDDVAAWEFEQTPSPHPKYYDPVSWETSWNSHAATLMRRDAFLEVDGYDSSLFLYGEDVDLSYRLRRAGWHLRILPDALAHHETALIRSLQRSHILLANRLLRRRFGGWLELCQGHFLFKRILSKSQNIDERAATIQAQAEYHKIKHKFPSMRKSGTHFPFNGVHFDRRRIGLANDGPGNIADDTSPNRQPLVSIITRTHGDYRHLIDCITSVRQQRYPAIEHILVEDDAGDASHAHQLAHEIGNIRYIPLPKVGRSEAGNVGARTAKGQYLIWLDHDDLLYPDHVERLVQAMQGEAVAVATYSLSWEAMTVDRADYRQTRRLVGPVGLGTEVTPTSLMTANRIPIQSVLFRRSLFETLGGFNPAIDLHEDWDLWRRYADAGKFVSVPVLTSVYFTPGRLIDRYKRQLALRCS